MSVVDFRMIAGCPIYAAPHLLESSRHVRLCDVYERLTLLVWSLPVFRLLIAQQDFSYLIEPAYSRFGLSLFNAWHDDAKNCSTWTDAAGCRCEVDP